jgi:hypothetical protein
MTTDPLFVIRQAGAGGYFSNGTTYSTHKSRAEAEAALAKISPAYIAKYGACRIFDWTPTEAQVAEWRAAQE